VRPDEFDPARNSERAGSQRVPDHDRQGAADVDELVQQWERPADEPAAARDSGRRDEHEPSHSIRGRRRQLCRDDAAERMADDVDAFQSHRIEPTREPRAQIDGLELAREGGEIDRIHVAVRRQRLDHR
jgi:hypothetical protein